MLKTAPLTVPHEESSQHPGELSNLEWANLRLLGEVRLALIATAFLLLLFGPSAQNRLVLLIILGAYSVFGARLLKRVVQRHADACFGIAHWVDAAAYIAVVVLTGAWHSRFAIFLLFPVLANSFQRGMRPGMGLALICMVWLAGITLVQAVLEPPFNVGELSLAPVASIIVVALVITRWALSEVNIMRRLAFSNDLNRVFTPRYGLDHAVYELAEMLQAYHEADTCLIVMYHAPSDRWCLYQVHPDEKRIPVRAEQIDKKLAEPLLRLSPESCVIYRAPRFFWQRRVCLASHIADLRMHGTDEGHLSQLANLLDARAFVSLPVRSRNQTIGRMYLASQSAVYTIKDLRFLEHVLSQAGLMIENMQLVERLTLEVANDERKKISRDLHDGTIQPYVGLKLALEALHRKVSTDAVIAQEVQELLKMAADGINELRHYVGHLKGSVRKKPEEALLPAVRTQAAKFSEYYGIDTRVVADRDITVNGRVFEEVMFIVREGLSNIRRHSSSEHATLSLHAGEHDLVLEFSNDNDRADNVATQAFFPRSIGERASELGGSVNVQQRAAGITAVTVQIPI